MKKVVLFFKNIRTRVWAVVTFVLTVLMIVIWVLSSTMFYDSICIALGRERTLGRGEGSYYETNAQNKEQAYFRGNEINEKICEEGFVLLKNEDAALPLEKNAKISVFGKNSVNIVYGGSGSGEGNFADAPTLYDSLDAAGFSVNPVLKSFYEDDSRSGAGRMANPAIEDNSNSTLPTGETPQIAYSHDVIASYGDYKDAALVVLSRIGGEGNDVPRIQEGNPDKHYLEPDKNEEDLLNAVVNAGFKKVIVILNASTTMEIGNLVGNEKVDACLSVGGPGYSGINALGRILNGEVTPSGKTVDTWAADFTKDPTYFNFGNNGVAADNAAGIPDGAAYVENGKDTGYYFVDYEEGIYVGYRYYETRGYTDGEEWYSNNVVYPFGYGLSYTEFSWEIVNADDLKDITLTEANKNSDIEIQVRVKNIKDYPGRDVIELYCDAPESMIEKSSTVLCGFAKTGLLQPGDEEVVTIRFNPYYIASYDYSDANGNGIVGYDLEKGGYALKLKTDAHTQKSGTDRIMIDVAEDIAFNEAAAEGTVVQNRFEDADDQLDTVLSRTDWEGTMPATPNTRELTPELKEKLASKATNNPETDFKMPATGKEKVMNAFELRGKDYDAAEWDEFLDTFTFEELKDMFNRGAFKTNGILRFNLPETVASDGPVGFVNFVSDVDVVGNVSYASEYVLGCTWNTALAEAMGQAVGEEAVYGKGDKIPTPYTGWYAPGINLHRSPFGGRNFEYFSEDPYLTGFMAAAEIRGVQSKGVIPYMKHFALNEQETHRDENGVATWATEQAIRELYLRPFEIAVKTADAKGIMSSFNRIGTVWTGGDYRLLTEVLRNEWGFEGAVICDFNACSYMSPKQMAYAGGDLNLTILKYWMKPDENSPGDVSVLRRAAHNVLYAVVNSNAMNGIDENTVLRVAMPVWQEVVLLIEISAAVVLAVWGFFEIRRFIAMRRDTSADEAVPETNDGALPGQDENR